MIDKTLAHYRITDKIGEGGMGVVFRAHDSKLDREVAIKILPKEMSGDPERIARFAREARTLASLQHANVAAVYGYEEVDDIRFFVMELVDGEDLAKRLARGPLPVDDVLAIAGQIAGALEAAHDAGVVHRDLKPANIVVNNKGVVKVLDFGLAKALNPDAASGSDSLSQSPTVTSPETTAGVILGTAPYMSPEQARGQTAGRQSDIWAFGAVLYELLTGKRPFRGETVSDTLAAVLKVEPDWSALPSQTPPAVRRLLRRCLAKDRRQRYHDIADARLELADAGEEPVLETSSRMPLWGWGLIVVAAAVALIAGSRLGGNDATDVEFPHRKFAVTLPDFSQDDWTRPVISPDGLRIAYRIENRLMIRDLNTLEDRAVTGGEDGNAPFWSPDGAWLAFAREAKLWKVPAAGGQPVMLCDLPDRGELMGGAWSNRDRIAVSILHDAIYELSAQGGVPRVFVEPDSAIGSDFQSILFLPDGETLLTTPHPQQKWAVSGSNMGKILAVRDGEARVVLGDKESLHCHSIAWSPTGHLLYTRAFTNEGIWAVPFSLDRLETTGEPILVAANGELPSVAGDGTLAYVLGAPDAEYELVWVDRAGEVLGTVGKPALSLRSPALSPDGTRVAYNARSNHGEAQDIYIRGLAGGAPVRLTFTEQGLNRPEWSPDGRLVVFESGMQIAAKPADGTGELRELFSGSRPTITPDGLYVIYHHYHGGKELRDVLVRPLDGSGDPVALVDGPAEEEGRLSPEGDHLAYTSDETGTEEVYLTRYPSGEGKWQVSTNGGRGMRWVAGGNELIYRDTDGALMSVEIKREPDLLISDPVRLFDGDWNDRVFPGRGFDVSSDGMRLLMVRRIPMEGDEPTVVIVQNWLAEF